jgi:hypothetical protein
VANVNKEGKEEAAGTLKRQSRFVKDVLARRDEVYRSVSGMDVFFPSWAGLM